MHKQPVLLRRTGSSLVIPSNSSSGGVGGQIPVPGSGGQVDPNAAIPIADEDPGLDRSSRHLAATSHKRKQSGIPLEAEAIINRTQTNAHMAVEQIADEEEGSFCGEPDNNTREESPHNNDNGGNGGGGSSSSMPEFSEWFPDNGNGQGGWSIKSLLTSRGIAGMTFVMMALAFVALRPTASSSIDGNRSSSPAAPGAGAAAGVGATASNNPQHDSKEITVGENHEEITGTPMQHTAHEYNNIRFFDSPDKMEKLHSKGPILWDDEMGGLHLFENVCLTTNVDALRYRPDPDESLRGLIYFTDDEKILSNPKRCVPCSNSQPMENWEDASKDRKVLGHKCGMNGLHAMFASSVGDWSNCIMEDENTKLMEDLGQTQSPLDVTTIHFFQEPTFLLQFHAQDNEKSLFDMLMTYLPHWDKFLGDEDGFPFNSVISHSLEGCLSHSHNWFCEVLHQMYAFGEKTKEIPWEDNDNTLYCYKELFYNQVGYQRKLDHEGLVTRENFGEFREMLFRKFGLPRRRTVEDRLEELELEKKASQGAKGGKGGEDSNDDASDEDTGSNKGDTKIIFYDNKLSEQTVWEQMESLISKARELEKYQNIKFVTAKGFGDLTVAQQARKFNEADAVIMAHGPHMANAIFAVDGTSFVEVGCKVESLIGNPRFMKLMDGKYNAVEKCNDKNGRVMNDDNHVCVVCNEGGEGGDDDSNFTMSPAAFERLIDNVVASLGD